ncbi:MAG: T9SS type A sorting domain-containing protein [Flavobacteriales bacterium]|nr:T9SS type A sorting domain-containing protein [Flavobacteriales bacterium]
MIRFILFSIGVSLISQSNAQVISQALLDLNNVEAMVNDGGVFFNDHGNADPGYEVPKGSGLNAIFALAFWYGGTDVNGQLKLSAQKYENLTDQFKGPLSTDGTAQASTSSAWANQALFSVTQEEIDYHLANYMTPGYQPSSAIANWPAHGDVSVQEDFYLAPFVDSDGDGIYNPMTADHPCIRGDKAIYVIMNDKGDLHASGGDPIGLEMHYMFYEYVGIPEIENTTFVHLKIINRGVQTLNDFKVSTFLDADLGFFGDDYFGSDESRNMMFFYNGDNLDEDNAGTPGYQTAPPAIGLVSLANDFESIGITDAGSTAPEFWSNMNARNASGALWEDPVTMTPTNFMFPSDPGNVSQPNSEVTLANAPGDRKGIANINLGTLVSFSEYTFDYAVIYNREAGGDNIQNASGLKNVADAVQDFFDTTFVDDCLLQTAAIDELEEVNFSIHPNPSVGEFVIALGDDFTDASVMISDLSGRVVMQEKELNSTETLIQLDQPSGVYLVHLTSDGRTTVKRMVLN